ncbi:hypothetical protein C7D73_31005, partial [Klebsiella pneumoniae]
RPEFEIFDDANFLVLVEPRIILNAPAEYLLAGTPDRPEFEIFDDANFLVLVEPRIILNAPAEYLLAG